MSSAPFPSVCVIGDWNVTGVVAVAGVSSRVAVTLKTPAAALVMVTLHCPVVASVVQLGAEKVSLRR